MALELLILETAYLQVDDVIPILPPAVVWVAAATLVVMFPMDSLLVALNVAKWVSPSHHLRLVIISYEYAMLP